MTTIKKAFAPIVELLEGVDPSTPVADVLPDVIELAAAKVGNGGARATQFHRDEHGDVIAVRCYYFKKWFNVNDVEFGAKKSSASGLNSMCKEGLNNWTKQQAQMKKAKEALLEDVAAGQVEAGDIPTAIAEIEAEAKEIRPTDLPGFDTLEELQAHYGV